MKQQKNYFITSALPYVNNTPHLGNIIGSTLSGDIYARYKRAQGHKVVYVCGTDEYGSTTTIKAKLEGLTPQQICDKYHKEHIDVYNWFNIQFDYWGRTTTEDQKKITHDIFLALYRNGLIEEKELVLLHCNKCNMFLADRYIKGTCYHQECMGKNSIANGDQCDTCQKIIDINKLIDPFCYVCKNTPKPKKTNHLFLKLDELSDQIENYLTTKTNLKPQILSIAKSWLKMGLTSRCITRDLDWGIPIPQGIDDLLDRYKNKVFYVWFDAPFGYYSILANNLPNWRDFLFSPDLEWISTQAKDNVPFHTIFFPGSIIGSGLPYPLISQICGTEYLLYEGKKFSKSEGIGLFGSDVIEISKTLDINEDYWRFYLVKIRPETQDSSFTISDFISTIRSDLINNIGNFINRCVSFTSKYCGNKTPIVDKDSLEKYVTLYESLMDDFKFRDALKLCLELSSEGNSYLQTNEPWVVVKTNINKATQIIGKANTICLVLLKLLWPIIPKTIERILSCIRQDDNYLEIINKIDIPFNKIDLASIEKLSYN